jgi:class 3 adenylate cyclase
VSATYKIMVVDDEDDVEMLVRQKLRRQVREGQYELLFAKDGIEALNLLQTHPDTDIVFTDINMPRMDGLTLLVKIFEALPLLKTVIISAYSDMENIRTAMNRGAFDFICKPFDFEDFETTLLKTLQAVEQVRHTLQSVRENNILKMYVGSGVLNFMCRQQEDTAFSATETVEASIAFIDLCGFTALSEQEPPNLLVRLLNKYFDVMVKEIIAQDGYVDKFIGDAILAVFRNENHLERALHAALAIHERFLTVEDALSDGQNFSPKVTIGINSGEVITGNVGSAALRRFDFTVIGDVVNTAQRLQAKAQPGQILVNEDSRQKLGEAFRYENAGEFRLRNKAKKATVFGVGKV